jgi:hypothetical protein
MYDTEIHVEGKIDPNLSDWFGEMQMQENTRNETILRGKLPDMSAVYGVISRLSSLVIPLVSVTCVEGSDANDQNPFHPSLREENKDEPTCCPRRC